MGRMSIELWVQVSHKGCEGVKFFDTQIIWILFLPSTWAYCYSLEEIITLNLVNF